MPAFHPAAAATRTELVEHLDDIEPAEWNALSGARQPFLRHEFLAALERHGCVGGDSGWQPRHLLLRDRTGALLGAMPLYLKDHSWGEFVFDWAWADAYRRTGHRYYPKLVAAIPFTPASGARVLAHPDAARPAVALRLLEEARALAEELDVSSLHVLFPDTQELGWMEQSGFMLRKDCQFQWVNRGYASFDEYVAEFSSAKRKKVRRERRRVRESDIRLELLAGREIDPPTWRHVYRFYASTFLKRGHAPYCSAAFFREIAGCLDEQLLVVLARAGRTPVAAAIFFRDETTLYGRYWGSDSDRHSLHFEACYYQGIEYCIRNGLQRFEPGTQGEHKLSRGFRPTATWSAHRIADPRFRTAIARYLAREREHVDAYIAAAEQHLPFRAGCTDEDAEAIPTSPAPPGGPRSPSAPGRPGERS